MKLAFRIVSFIGSVFMLFFMGIIAPFMYGGGSPMGLVVVSTFLAYLFAPFAATVLTYGLRHALWGFAGLSIFLKRVPLAPMQEAVIKSGIRFVYATCALSFIFALIITMGAVAGPRDELGEHFAHGLVSLVYGVVIAEFILRPALKRSELLRIEQTMGETHPSFKKLWFPMLFWGLIVAGTLIMFGAMIYWETRRCH